MLIFLAFSLFSSNSFDSIRKMLNAQQFKAAFEASNSKIIQQGVLKADPVLFFIRGYANIKIGKYNHGISDLSRFLTSSKKINQKDKLDSYSLRCTAYLKTGKIEEALDDASKSKNEALIKTATRANLLFATAISTESSPKFSLSKYEELIKICPFSEDFLLNAANVALSIGDSSLFLEFSQRVLKINQKNAKILEIFGRYHFSQMELKEAEEFAKKCIKSSPDPSNCSSLLKSIENFKKNEKEAADLVSKKKFDKAKKYIEICQQIVKKYSSEDSPLANQLNKINVKVLIAKDEKEDAIECLNGLIKAFPENNEFLIHRGQLLLDFNDYSGAISDFQVVKKRTNCESIENKEVVKLIEKASELQEKEKKMNYYTVMGLDNGASVEEVKKAYKKLVVMWHPDRFNKPLKKKEAEKKMMMINKAYDVLGDENKKKMYDFDIEYYKQQNINKNYRKNYQNRNYNNNDNKKDDSKNNKSTKKSNPKIVNEIIDRFGHLVNELRDIDSKLTNIENGIKKLTNLLQKRGN